MNDDDRAADERERARDWGTSEYELKRQQEYSDERDRRQQEENRIQTKNRIRYTAALLDLPLELRKSIQSGVTNPCFTSEFETCAPDRGCFALHLRDGSHPATMQDVISFLRAQTFQHDIVLSWCYTCGNNVSQHRIFTEGCVASRYHKDARPRDSLCPFENCALAYEWANHIKCVQCRAVVFRYL